LIIDCHTHLNRYTPDEPASLGDRYARMRAMMAALEVDQTMVLTSFRVNDERPSIAAVLDAVDGDPRIGVVAGIRNDLAVGDQLPELREHLANGRIRGLKLYPGYAPFYPHDSMLWPVYELAAEFRVPVMVHTGDTYDPKGKVKYAHPLEMDEVAVDFRDVTFVICHLGNPWFTDAMEVIYKNANVVGDISGLAVGAFEARFERFAMEQLREVVAFTNDPTKILFGSDWPISDVASHLRLVRQLDLTAAEREGILWRNAARVFQLDVGELAAERNAAPVGGGHDDDR